MKKRFDMMLEDAAGLATTLENIFDDKDEISDDTIDRSVRSLFYALEQERFLRVRRIEYKDEGRVLRGFYWSLNNSELEKDGFEATACREIPEDPSYIYKRLPAESWRRG
ncbi:MAG: hypothetical protein CVT48_03950 [Thermoplasmata archaeon HGW-Thermoplasmata-1]|nr:MAG: hypothetical protein CVT48_03950 [Thermoplasmata archaeon HGW-Thermoplasmata-1]